MNSRRRTSSKSFGLCTIAVIALPLLLMGCGSAVEQSGAGVTVEGLTAEADLYSGRENPTWLLSGEVSELVLACATEVEGSAEVDGDPELELGLGFRGFLISGEGLTAHDLRRVRITEQRLLSEAMSGGWTAAPCGGQVFEVLLDSAPDDVRSDIEEVR